jgi:hypothetical protein
MKHPPVWRGGLSVEPTPGLAVDRRRAQKVAPFAAVHGAFRRFRNGTAGNARILRPIGACQWLGKRRARFYGHPWRLT